MLRAHPHRRVRWTTRTALAAWIGLATADGLAVAELIPWLPGELHGLAVGVCVTVACAAMLMRIDVPVRAAFLDGMLHERANPGRLHVQPLPRASGDDQAGGATVHLMRRGSGGRHARPTPRPRQG